METVALALLAEPDEVVSHANAYYVGPDNGVFAYLEPRWTRVIENRSWPGWSTTTFHGHDVFAPVAAAIARGIKSSTEIGTKVELEGTLPWGPLAAGENRLSYRSPANLVSDLPRAEAGKNRRDRGATADARPDLRGCRARRAPRVCRLGGNDRGCRAQ